MRTWLGLSVSLVTAACVSTSVQQMDTDVRSARSPETVAVLVESPDRPYTVIAVIEGSSDLVFDSFDDIREKMVVQAAELGGDALIVGRDSTVTRFILTGTAMIQSDSRRLLGEVIVYEGG